MSTVATIISQLKNNITKLSSISEEDRSVDVCIAAIEGNMNNIYDIPARLFNISTTLLKNLQNASFDETLQSISFLNKLAQEAPGAIAYIDFNKLSVNPFDQSHHFYEFVNGQMKIIDDLEEFKTTFNASESEGELYYTGINNRAS